MAQFLTPAWIAELDEAARASSTLRAIESRLVVEQRVTATPDGECRYHVVLGDGPARVEPGAAPSPDLVLGTDYETAVAMYEGRENAQGAIDAGRLHVYGNLETVLRHAGTLTALDDVFVAVRKEIRSRSGDADDAAGTAEPGSR